MAHSLGVSWQQYDERVYGDRSSAKLEPQQWSIDYYYQLNELWTAGASLWRSDAERNWSDQVSLQQQGEGVALSLSFEDLHWWLGLGFSISRSELNGSAQSSGELFSRGELDEDSESYEISASINWEWALGEGWLSPGLTLAHQQSESLRVQTLRGSGAPLEQRNQTEQEGAYLNAGLHYAWPWFHSASSVLMPYVAINWMWEISGNVALQQTLQWNRYRDTNSSHEGGQNDQSGSALLGLNYHWQTMFFDLSWSEAIDEPSLGSSLVLGLGVAY